MRIKLGGTRIVFLTDSYAIKIARIRPVRFIFRILLLLFSRSRRTHFLVKYGPGMGTAILRDIFAGLYSNRGEYEYYRESRDARIAPTLSIFFAGMVAIQPRGADVHCPVDLVISDYIDGEKTEVCDAEQFKKIGRRILLVDYGRRSTVKALRQTLTSC